MRSNNQINFNMIPGKSYSGSPSAGFLRKKDGNIDPFGSFTNTYGSIVVNTIRFQNMNTPMVYLSANTSLSNATLTISGITINIRTDVWNANSSYQSIVNLVHNNIGKTLSGSILFY